MRCYEIRLERRFFSFLDLFGLNLWWVKKFDQFSGVTILLSLTVFHNIVTEKLPQVSDAMPLLGITRIILFIETKSFCVCPYFIPSAEWKQTSVHNNASTWKSFHPSSNKKCNFSNWVYWLHVWQVHFLPIGWLQYTSTSISFIYENTYYIHHPFSHLVQYICNWMYDHNLFLPTALVVVS